MDFEAQKTMNDKSQRCGRIFDVLKSPCIEVLMQDATTRDDGDCQDRPNGTNRFDGQAQREATPPDCRKFDSNTVPQTISAHRQRRPRTFPRSRGLVDRYIPAYSKYYNHDSHHFGSSHCDSPVREPLPEAFQHRAEVSFVAAMADLDVREERDDRRGGDSYRGGGNKRRRDGKRVINCVESVNVDGQFIDDHDNYSRDRGRGPQRRRNDDGPRRRYEEPPFPKLRRLLLNIASSTKLPQDEAIEIAKLFGEHYDDERLRSDFLDVFVQL